jgi:hypothetical protein
MKENQVERGEGAEPAQSGQSRFLDGGGSWLRFEVWLRDLLDCLGGSVEKGRGRSHGCSRAQAVTSEPIFSSHITR